MKGKVFFATVLMGICVGLFLCAGIARSADTINIGILGPFTGPTAFNGEEMKKGMMLAVDEINEKGGIFGMKVNLVYGDTESKPDRGVAVVKKLITKDQVLVVGGGYHSSVSIATSEVCEREKTPDVVAIAIAPLITNRGFTYVFRTSPNSPQFLEGLNAWLENVKKPKAAAFFMENSDYGRDGEKIWSDEMKKIGATELTHLYFQIGDTDFTTQISKLKELKPEVTFCIGSTTEQALIQKQAKELNFVTQWIGVGGHFTEAFFKMVGLDARYAMGVSLEPTLNMKDPLAADFVKRYAAKFEGARPGIFSGQGYDNIMVILDAVKRAGKPTGDLQKDRDNIREALTKTSINLTQGKIEFDKTGQVSTVVPYVVQVQNVEGKAQLAIVYPPEKATAAYEEPKPWDKR